MAGLRDKVIFLAARGEVYGVVRGVRSCSRGVDIIIAAKLVCLVIWMGAATSKLNKHFPFVISTMMSQQPGDPAARRSSAGSSSSSPTTCGPGGLSRWLAHFSTAIEMLVPLVLFFSHGGWPTAIAAFVMVCFHFGILSAIPMGVPLEWNVFMIFSVLALFVGHADIGLGDLTSPWPVVLFAVVVAAPWCSETCSRARSPSCPACGTTPATGTPRCGASSRRPRRRSTNGIVAIASMPAAQLEKFYGSKEAAQIPIYMGYAFRAFNTHGRALFTLAHRAMAGHERGRLRPSPTVSGSAAPPSAGTSATATCTTSS